MAKTYFFGVMTYKLLGLHYLSLIMVSLVMGIVINKK